MNKRGFFALISIINIAVTVFFLVQYANATYPLIGHDYRQCIPNLMDSHLYYKVSGLSIEWYTPNFGGGLPSYPNPLQMQFSLPQLVTWFVNPYIAVFASLAIYISIGFLVIYLFLHQVIELKTFSALLGADFFLINGFLIERVAVGHDNFFTYPLIIIPIFAILNPRLPKWVAGALISIVGAVLVYSGGVYIALICLFATLIVFPLLYFLKPGLYSWRRIIPVLIWGGILTGLLCGSKLYATAAYMRFFPRTAHDSFGVNWITGLRGMVLQLVGTLNWYPLLSLLHKTSDSYILRLIAWTRTPYSFWELDSSIAPGLLILLFYGAILLLIRLSRIKRSNINLQRIISGLGLLFAIVLASEFSIAKGFLYQHLSQLDILKSIHADTRFAASFILPLAILGAKVFDIWTAHWESGIRTFLAYAILSGISLASMWSYYLMPLDIQNRTYDVHSMFITYNRIAAGETFPVLQIVPNMNDYEVFMFNSSNTTRHYDTLFGDKNKLLTTLVHKGSIFDMTDGFYNMTNPSSLLFPEENGVKLFERIPVSDYTKLIDFINHRPSDWRLPVTQIILDWVAGITILFEIGAFLIYLLKRLIPFQKLHLFQTSLGHNQSCY